MIFGQDSDPNNTEAGRADLIQSLPTLVYYSRKHCGTPKISPKAGNMYVRLFEKRNGPVYFDVVTDGVPCATIQVNRRINRFLGGLVISACSFPDPPAGLFFFSFQELCHLPSRQPHR